MAEFCTGCGSKLRGEDDSFCGKCGKRNLELKTDSEAANIMNLSEFMEGKSNERRTYFNENKTVSSSKFKKRKSVASSSTTTTKEDNVLINIGLIKDSNGQLSIVRGSKLPIKVSKKMTAEKVCIEAVQKHAAHDQYFCGLEDYFLLYPDQKIVDTVPGTTEKFTVERYKQELAKPYSKIVLFLCKECDYVYDLTKWRQDDLETPTTEIENFKVNIPLLLSFNFFIDNFDNEVRKSL